MRPTRSPTLLLQMIGRGLRNAPGKDKAIIFDHAGLANDHGHPDGHWPWSLHGGAAKARRAAMTRGPRRCPECKEVRAERVEVCSCGYEFPTGREIGEFDGVLTEVRGVVPEGCVTRDRFAKEIGSTFNTVVKMIQNGMPVVSGYVPLIEARVWVNENYLSNQRPPSEPGEWMSAHAFFARYGISSGAKLKMKKMGFDKFAANGWINREAGDKWMRENWRSPNTPPVNVSDKSEYEMPHKFAKRVGVSASLIKTLVKRGMPAANNGWPHTKTAEAWFKAEYTSNQNACGLEMPEQCESQLSFSKRYGVSDGVVAGWVKRGMPVERNGWVRVPVCKTWVARNWRPRGKPPIDVACSADYESRVAFGTRIGRSGVMVKNYCERGLPCASNGWVHIQRGLEWVRDNTDIKIPASAWPKKAAKSKRNRPPDELRPGL
jgi:hypothetical protein